MIAESQGPHEPAQVRVGDILGGRYEVLRLIGQGAMGVVVEARHVGHGQRVAVKILHERYRSHEEAVGRFAQEGRAAARVRGEHSVRLYDTGEHDGCPFLVMELLVGRDLSMLLEDGPMSVDEAAAYLLQACEGMAEVHAHGIVHRDLKPSNLFVTTRPDGTPLLKVLDFGIAKGVRTEDEAALVQTQTFVAMGTPLYMSPEQIRSSSSVDARADVWSLGTIFYELVGGRPAFGGNTVSNITAQVLEREPPALSTVAPTALPAGLDAVVACALRKRPDERYVDVAALAAALEPFAPSSSAGAAERCARILRGALRQDVGTTPPVAHDDALGGTVRFDRSRRTRVVQGLVAALAIATCALVAMALTAYRKSAPASGQVLAREGLGVIINRRIDRLAPIPTSPAGAETTSAAATPSPPTSEPTASAPTSSPAASSVAALASARSRSEAPSQAKGTATAKAQASEPPPAHASPPAPAAPPPERPFNPFSERN
ncbi:MAG: serine/threonine protein kinase [Polyangiaceae bacterium]|nr:serine/threonine protein kinase [Polyangiaceae bacterium]